jgi:dipeptidyl aminopeptidase/acylaminoacyl peptidase
MRLALIALAAAVLAACSSAVSAAEAPRRFEVRDSVGMSYFGNPASSAPADMDDDGVVSPDGRQFVKVTHRGVLPEGVTEGTIWLFDARSIKRSIRDSNLNVPKPVPLERMSAAVNGGLGIYVLDAGNTITDPHWSEDSRSLTFLGRNGHANRQLFRVDLETHSVKALTPTTQDVLVYAKSGGTFVYLAGPDADLHAEQAWVSAGRDIPDIVVGTGTPLMPLLYPHFRGLAYGEPLEVQLWQVRDDQAMPVVDSFGAPVRFVTRYTSLLISLSPDAARALTVAEKRDSQTTTQGTGGAGHEAPSLRYHIVELHSGNIYPLESAPIAIEHRGRHRAAWSADGTQVAVTEALLPNAPNSSSQPLPCDVAVVRIGALDARCIAPSDHKHVILAVDWLPGTDELHARYTVSDESSHGEKWLRLRRSEWIVEKHPVKPQLGVELSVREGLNDPPVLVATDPETGKSREIFDPNPQLAAIGLGSVRVYRWKDPRGTEVSGGLVVPPDFAPGKRYGLVIQTHGFSARRFFLAGYSDTSNAGRALAGRGLLVLQVREPGSAAAQTWRDGVETGLDVYLAAIDKLAEEGLIDPTRVGISGYSHSGWLVATSIARAPNRFAAAEIANSDPVTLTGYYGYVGTPLAATDANLYVGARPYGEGLKLWTERVPSLSTDKITAPVLFQAADPWHLLGFWDMYAAMLDQDKPVELQYMRSGEHNIRKPLQVLAHQEMIVDWFDFWLNGHEDPDSTKSEQYVRWRKLRHAPGT